MGPVGSRLASGPPSGGGPRRQTRYRSRALAIILVLLIVMCGMIAWSQWYAIHVNVPLYEARHAHAVTH
jgi:hypothetical protein